MERTGGEPDMTGQHKRSGEFIFTDCSAPRPAGRQSIGDDRAALEERKDHKPRTSARDMAEARGADLLAEEQYRELPKLGEFDPKSSSWVIAPADLRQLGGALFGDRRSGRAVIYPHGAQSYYAGRGLRSSLRV